MIFKSQAGCLFRFWQMTALTLPFCNEGKQVSQLDYPGGAEGSYQKIVSHFDSILSPGLRRFHGRKVLMR